MAKRKHTDYKLMMARAGKDNEAIRVAMGLEGREKGQTPEGSGFEIAGKNEAVAA